MPKSSDDRATTRYGSEDKLDKLVRGKLTRREMESDDDGDEEAAPGKTFSSMKDMARNMMKGPWRKADTPTPAAEVKKRFPSEDE